MNATTSSSQATQGDATAIPPAYFPISANGLTELINPEEPLIDIVFVHGFTGHPERTWLHKSTSVRGNETAAADQEPPSKLRKISSAFTSRKKKHVYWPVDLLPSVVPEARILTFGYDTRISYPFGPERSQSGVYAIARDFLLQLEGMRRPAGRPILFIVHSLGGIVVKEMLKASAGSHLEHAFQKDVFESTAGIVFFGTPHGGADPRGLLHHVAQSIAKALGITANQQVVDTLLPSSERLEELRDHFKPMAIHQDWLIYSFQEALGVQSLGKKVVEDVSSCLDLPREVRQHIHSNHMEMCRFGGPDDQQFQKVKYALQRLVDHALSNSRAQPPGPAKETLIIDLTEEQKSRLRQSLSFDQLEARQGSIRNAHEKTCAWLTERQEYLDWLDPTTLDRHCGFLWIKGKPGAGKSTIMKFMYNKMKRSSNSSSTIAFFFNARGDEMEKSTLGMYRSILLQLLDEVPEIWSIFNDIYKLRWQTVSNHKWDIGVLQELLGASIYHIGTHPVVLFIDALDECDDSEVHDMVDFMEQLSGKATSLGTHMHICFASRHYPTIQLDKGIEIVLEDQDGHAEDIKKYIESKLKLGRSQAAKDFGSEVQEKAAGVFMWVVLVVQILNDKHSGGRGRIQELRRQLKVLPRGLHDLFRNILGRDASHMDDLTLCLQWILFAKRPLTPHELYFAVLSGGSDPEVPTLWDREDIPEDMIQRFILNSSKGLAETTKSKRPTVQFIHESVRDFLLKENGLIHVYKTPTELLEGKSHDRLGKCCSEHLIRVSISKEMVPILSNALPEAQTPEGKLLRERCTHDFPFLEYAVKYMLYHAERAQSHGVFQTRLLEHFSKWPWASLNNILEKHQIRRYKTQPLDYILAERDFPALLEYCWAFKDANGFTFFNDSGERYGPPLLAAAACESRKTLKRLITLQACFCHTEDLIPDLHRQCDEIAGPLVERGRAFKFNVKNDMALQDGCIGSPKLLQTFAAFLYHHAYEDSQLSYSVKSQFTKNEFIRDETFRSLIRSDNALALRVLLRSNAFRTAPDRHFGDSLTPLIMACIEKRQWAVSTLLEADPLRALETDSQCMAPLAHACRTAQPGIISTVLEATKRASNIQERDNFDHEAEANHELEELAELMIEHSDDSFAAQSKMSALAYYATKSNQDMVKLILRSGVKADYHPPYKSTALVVAIQGNHADIVDLILEAGADTELFHEYDNSPLSHAAISGHERIVTRLLESGADVNGVSNDGRAALSFAAECGHEQIVTRLLESGADFNAFSDDRRTALSFAAECGREQIVTRLLESGADVDGSPPGYRTALSYAAEMGHDRIVGLLLREDAAYTKSASAATEDDIHTRVVSARRTDTLLRRTQVESLEDLQDTTPLHYAARMGHVNIVEQLLQKGVQPAVENWEGQTALSLAALEGHCSVIELLVLNGAAVNNSSSTGEPPLAMAAKGAHYSAVEILDRQAEPESGWLDAIALSPPASPAKNRHYSTIELLLDKGADINARDSNEKTALSYVASSHHNQQAVELLLSRGALVNTVDDAGMTPLMYAIESKSADIVSLLLQTGQAKVDSKTLSLSDRWSGEGVRFEDENRIMEMLKPYRTEAAETTLE